MEFKTLSGSTYLIDDGTKTFMRKSLGSHSGLIRTPEQTFIRFNSRSEVVVGEGVHFYCDPIDPKAEYRDVYTSDVTEILEETK
jgi:hypothetical protein